MGAVYVPVYICLYEYTHLYMCIYGGEIGLDILHSHSAL